MFEVRPLPRTLEAALRDLTHAKFAIRLSAVRDLSTLARGADANAARAALVQALASDEAPGIRAESAVALADSESQACVSELLIAAQDEHPRVRQMALLALGELSEPGEPRVLALLESARRAAEPEIRFQALLALHRLAPEKTIISMLSDGTRDDDPEVRHIAFRCAEDRFGRPPAQCPELLLQRARAALLDDDMNVRLAAAILLAHSGDAAGADAIVSAVNQRPRLLVPEDEQTAIELCGELALKQAEPGLSRRAFGLFGFSRDAFAWHACIALARLGDMRAKSMILKGLRAWSRDARTMAVAAAGRATLVEAREIIARMAHSPERADPNTVTEALAALEAAEAKP